MDKLEPEHFHEHTHDHADAHQHPHHENTKYVQNRLARASGHLQHVRAMVDSGEDCSDVENGNYQFSSIQTSRAFFGSMNMTGPIIQDAAVRRAIAMGIDKQGFVSALLDGHGVPGWICDVRRRKRDDRNL